MYPLCLYQPSALEEIKIQEHKVLKELLEQKLKGKLSVKKTVGCLTCGSAGVVKRAWLRTM